MLVNFWSSWCGPCGAFAPVFDRASEEHPDIVFAMVDTEVERALASAFDIMSIQTLMVVRDGVVVYMQPSALGPAALEDLIGKVQAVDMSDVHRQLAESRTSARMIASGHRAVCLSAASV